MKNFKEIAARLKGEREEFKKIRASFDETASPDVSNMLIDFSESIHRRISWLEDDLYDFMRNHLKNHPPHPQTVSQMKAALKAFGMGDDFDVEKKILTMAKQGSLKEFLEGELKK